MTCGGPGRSSPKLKLLAKNPKGNAPADHNDMDEKASVLTDAKGHVESAGLVPAEAKP